MAEMERKAKRSLKIDLLRLISCFAVIMIHMVTAPIIGTRTEISETALRVYEKIHVLLRWSVPMFFMISGYCCLGREKCDYRYCFRHIRKYILVLFTFGLAYNLLEEVYKVRSVNLNVCRTAVLNVINGRSWAHMWFVYAIIGVYLVYPVMHAAFEKSRETALAITSLLFVFTILLPVVNSRLNLNIDVSFPFGSYLFYVCLGGFLSRYGMGKRYRIIFAGLGLASMIFIMFERTGMEYTYLSLPVCLMAMGIFSVIPDLAYQGTKGILPMLVSCSFGIYLIHPLLINIIIKVCRIDLVGMYPAVSIPVTGVLVFAASFGMIYVMKKVLFILCRRMQRPRSAQ